MIDNFSLFLTHGLLLLAAWRILSRPDLEDDSAAPPPPNAEWRGQWRFGVRRTEETPGA